MKKYFLLVLFTILAVSLSSQVFQTDKIIEGLGDIRLKSTKKEFVKQLENHLTPESELLKGLFMTEVTNVRQFGYIFDVLSYDFSSKGLSYISFTLKLDKENTYPEEFEKLLLMLEKDYGKMTNRDKHLRSFRKKSTLPSSEDNSLAIYWRDEDDGLLSLTLMYVEKEKKNWLSVTAHLKSPFF